MPEGFELTAPRTGPAARTLWPLPRGLVFLDHGSYGLTPKPVLRAQARLKAEMERDPVRFLERHALGRRLAEARRPAGAALACDPEDLVFVDNATSGINAVLRSIAFAQGAEILTTDRVYPAVRHTIGHVLSAVGGRLVEVALPWPAASDEEIVAAVERQLSKRTALALFDLIASRSAIRLPVERLTGLCRGLGVPVLIDAAHGPGQVPIEIPRLHADWVTANLHKWHFAPRGCGFLWARPERAAHLHPTVISLGYGEGYAAEFDWTGTKDVTPFLSVPAAIACHGELGGAALMARNRGLAGEAAALLAEAWGTEIAGAPEQRASMAAIRLPPIFGADIAAARRLHDRLFRRHRVQVSVFPIKEALWLRISAQAYNHLDEYRVLADAVRAEAGALNKKGGTRTGP